METETRQITPRSIVAGLVIGSLVLFSNFQFGLQTGWVSMMCLPSALLGFAAFKSLQAKLNYPFSSVENVFVQSLAVAVGTGPLAFGLVGVIPAIEKFLTPDESGLGHSIRLSISQLAVWSLGLAFFGVFFAVLLRRQIIEKEKLRFPSGSATAVLISVLNKTELKHPVDEKDSTNPAAIDEDEEQLLQEQGQEQASDDPDHQQQVSDDSYYQKNIGILVKSFVVSSGYTFAAYFVPVIRDLPIFGSYLASEYLWTFQPSPAYIGQGIIMGLPTVSSMLLGAVLGWGVLAPLAQHKEWATGPIDDWKTGAQGWILWVSLAVMVADAVVSFIAISIKSGIVWYNNSDHQSGYTPIPEASTGIESHDDDDAAAAASRGDASYPLSSKIEAKNTVSYRTAAVGLVGSLVACLITTWMVFGHVPVYTTFLAVLLALFLSVLAVRALGETDLNPVSGIGKISQVLFALIIPRNYPGSVLINLIAGAITEAGAQQAGDLMQDLKTGHLVGASPRAQFVAQLIGSAWSVFLSAIVYRLYDSVYEIPGKLFRIPTAVIWIDCSRLVTGEGLPPYVQSFALFFGVLFGAFAVVKVVYSDRSWCKYVPSGVAVGIGIYNVPSFTLARFLGGLVAHWYSSRYTDSVLIIVCSSGLVLGEGVTSIFSLIFTGLGVPHL